MLSVLAWQLRVWCTTRHLHLVPVNNGNELNPEKAKTATEAELNNIQKLILKIKKLSDFK